MNDRAEYFKQRYQSKRLEILSKQADYRKRNRDVLKEKARKYNLENKDKIREDSRLYRRENVCNRVQSYEQRAAHSKIAYAVKTGKLKRKPCGECGSPVAQAHHDDYADPLAVVWLCRECHTKYHREHGSYVKSSEVSTI